MNIKEAEKLSGVSVRNIRFYEQKGLLTPSRNKGNDYREYSEGDIRRLMLIRALRMVDMPLERIREITAGEIPLWEAARLQKESLDLKVSKLQVAAQFCEELAKEEPVDIEQILKRMDEPENSSQLNRKWPSDHRKSAGDICLALLAGVLPILCGIMFMSVLFLGEAGMLLSYVAMPFFWTVLGFYYQRKPGWLGNLALVHTVPLLCGLTCLWQSSGKPIALLDLVGFFQFPFFWMIQDMEPLGQLVAPMLFLLACFCLGGLLSWLVTVFRTGWRQIYANVWKKPAFIQNLQDTVPAGLIWMWLLIITPFLFVLGYCLFAPLDTSVTPEAVGNMAIKTSWEIWVETGDSSYELNGSAEFYQCFEFNEWDRVYFPGGKDQPVLEVHFSADRTEPHAVEFFADGTVRVYEAWLFLEEGFFRVPDGVIQKILAYAEAYGTPVQSAE